MSARDDFLNALDRFEIAVVECHKRFQDAPSREVYAQAKAKLCEELDAMLVSPPVRDRDALLGDALWSAGAIFQQLNNFAINQEELNHWEAAKEASERLGSELQPRPLPKHRTHEQAADEAADIVLRMKRRIEAGLAS